MKPPERFKWRVFPLWQPLGDGWQSIAHHEAGHVVAAEYYGVAPHSAVIEPHGGGRAYLTPPQVDPPAHDEERGALGVFGIVGLADRAEPFEEMALRAAVVLMAGQQAEFMQAGITPAGVVRTDNQDTRQAAYLLHLLLKTDVALGWAQLQARYLLGYRWERVEKIASVLREKGRWNHAE